jgi:RimJ/RimL family protein N-acetyltransferase
VSPIRLEPFASEHLPAFEAMLHDEDVRRFTPLPVPPPPGFGDQWLARVNAGRAAHTQEAFAILDEDATVVGVALAPRYDADAATAELGYLVAAQHRGRGIATDALRQLTIWASARGIERLELRIVPDNAASQRVAERCGYTRETAELWSRLAAG